MWMDATEIFVRGVWKIIPSEDDLSWVEKAAALQADCSPCGDYGFLIRKMLAAGISAEDIARFARIVGYKVAFQVCYHLGDPIASYEGFKDRAPEFEWNLYQIQDDKPVAPMRCTYEILLTADPSRREMRPKSGT